MNRRSLIELLLFMAAAMALALAGGSYGVWQSLDHLAFRALYLPQLPGPDPGIRLIDIEYPDELKHQDQPARYRETLGRVMQQLAALPDTDRPRSVLVDIWFASNSAAEESVMAGMAALRAKGVKVYATVEPKDRHGADSADFMQKHNTAIYTRALDGYGHTQLDYAFGVLKYERELALPVFSGAQRVGESRVPALPVLTAIAPEQAVNLPRTLVIPVGDDSVFRDRIHRVALGQGSWTPPFPAAPTTTHVIIGSLAEDSDNVMQRPGPLLLAWALSDLLAGKSSTAREPLNHPAALLGLSVLAAMCAAGVLALSFRMVRGKVVPSRWKRLAGGLAVLSFVLSALLLLALGGVFLLTQQVIPVALSLACAALASGFMWRATLRWIDDELTRTTLEQVKEYRAIQYDVFISYAHEPPENKDWVRRHVSEPITAMRHANGNALRVFFDESAIKVGTSWKHEIEQSLMGSRLFVPVYSDLYFSRPYCQEEINIADHLRIERRLVMLPVARRLDVIPEIYLSKSQFLDVQTRPGWQQELLDAISAELGRDKQQGST